jgi:hypothetical protein
MATDPTNPPVLSSFSLHVKITVAPENVDACTYTALSPYLCLTKSVYEN